MGGLGHYITKHYKPSFVQSYIHPLIQYVWLSDIFVSAQRGINHHLSEVVPVQYKIVEFKTLYIPSLQQSCVWLIPGIANSGTYFVMLPPDLIPSYIRNIPATMHSKQMHEISHCVYWQEFWTERTFDFVFYASRTENSHRAYVLFEIQSSVFLCVNRCEYAWIYFPLHIMRLWSCGLCMYEKYSK